MDILLLGTDFSTRSDRALRRAMILARQADLELLIVHVIDDDQPRRLLDSQRRESEALLGETARTITEQDGLACRTEVRLGRPSEELPVAARAFDARMMIIGPHRRAPIRDVFGAVTAERIARRSPVPLIVANAVPSGPYRRLLLPVDLEQGSRRAVGAAASLGMKAAEVTLLHVYDAEAREMLGRAMATSGEKLDYLSERRAQARQDLREFAASAGIDGALRVRESTGSVSTDIERAGTETAADLIVVARSNKGTIERGIVGSVTESLLRAVDLDILIVP